MSIVIKQRASLGMSNLVLALALMIAAGCGGKKALQTAETPAPQMTAMEPVTQPAREEKATPETARKEIASLQLETVYFDYDQYNLTPTAREILVVNAQTLRQNPEAAVTIEGHCDERGTIEYNLALGEKRAASVKGYLVSLGVERSRLNTISYGKERPADFRHTEEAWARNRRAEFVIKTPPSFSDSY